MTWWMMKVSARVDSSLETHLHSSHHQSHTLYVKLINTSRINFDDQLLNCLTSLYMMLMMNISQDGLGIILRHHLENSSWDVIEWTTTITSTTCMTTLQHNASLLDTINFYATDDYMMNMSWEHIIQLSSIMFIELLLTICSQTLLISSHDVGNELSSNHLRCLVNHLSWRVSSIWC